jgi:hypothetical protein
MEYHAMEIHPAMQISMIRGAGPLHQALQGERILSSSYRFGVGVGIGIGIEFGMPHSFG